MNVKSFLFNSNHDGIYTKDYFFNTIEQARYLREDISITKNSFNNAVKYLELHLMKQRNNEYSDIYNELNDHKLKENVINIVGYKSSSDLKKSLEFYRLRKLIDPELLFKIINYIEKEGKVTKNNVYHYYKYISNNEEVKKNHVYRMMLLMQYEYKKDIYNVQNYCEHKAIKELYYFTINFSNILNHEYHICYIDEFGLGGSLKAPRYWRLKNSKRRKYAKNKLGKLNVIISMLNSCIPYYEVNQINTTGYEFRNFIINLIDRLKFLKSNSQGPPLNKICLLMDIHHIILNISC